MRRIPTRAEYLRKLANPVHVLPAKPCLRCAPAVIRANVRPAPKGYPGEGG